MKESIAKLAATSPSPVNTTGFVPNFRSSAIDTGEMTRSSKAIGAMRRPVASAL